MQGQHPQRGGTGNNAVLEIEKNGLFGMNGGGGKNWFAASALALMPRLQDNERQK